MAARLHRVAAHLRSVSAAAPPAALPTFTAAEVAEHRGAASCWVVLWGRVYDFTAFVERHPGGARALLRHAGGDATAVFSELHSDAIFHAFAGEYLIGVLDTPPPAAAPRPPAPWGGARPARSELELDAPFPHARFQDTGVETARFVWAEADELIHGGFFAGGGRPEPHEQGHVFRQKSNLSPLEARDWLHIGSEKQYSADMNLKLRLLAPGSAPAEEGTAAMCYVSCEAALAAEREVLHETLAFVTAHHPDRFHVDLAQGFVETRTPGYAHTFQLADFEACPLRLVGMLVQEDFFLLVEEEAVWQPGLRAGQGGKEGEEDEDAVVEWAETHPSGKQHVFNSACSCFSFDAREKHMQDMSIVHHPGVGGWMFHLQRGMNRLYADMEPSQSWYRHSKCSGPLLAFSTTAPERSCTDFGFNLLSDRTHSLSHGLPWAPFVDDDALAKKEAKEEEEKEEKTHNSLSGRRRLFPGLAERLEEGGVGAVANEVALHIEFQTLRRFPSSRYILFTVRSYDDPMADVAAYPAAAQALAAAIRRKYKAGWLARGFGGEEATRAMLDYLDSAAAAAGLEPGLKGKVEEPWERRALVDGTEWPAAEGRTAEFDTGPSTGLSPLRVDG